MHGYSGYITINIDYILLVIMIHYMGMNYCNYDYHNYGNILDFQTHQFV